jgi:hypothetical protein
MSSSEARTGPSRPSKRSETREGPAESGSVVRASSSEAQGVRVAAPADSGIVSRRTPFSASSLKTWWIFAAFVSGLGLAMIAEDLMLEHRNNRLEFSAPRTDFFAGSPMARLRNAAEVPFQIKTTLWSGNRNHVFASAVDQFVVSFDLWEQTYSVVKMQAPRQSASHLTAKAAQAWCLSQMALDTSGLSGAEPLWAQLEIRAEPQPRDGTLLGDSVNSSGISVIAGLIDIFSRPPGAQPHWMLEYPQFTLDQLKHQRGT